MVKRLMKILEELGIKAKKRGENYYLYLDGELIGEFSDKLGFCTYNKKYSLLFKILDGISNVLSAGYNFICFEFEDIQIDFKKLCIYDNLFCSISEKYDNEKYICIPTSLPNYLIAELINFIYQEIKRQNIKDIEL